MANTLDQVWDLPEGGTIQLHIIAPAPFPEVVWKEDLPNLAHDIEILRLHLGGDM